MTSSATSQPAITGHHLGSTKIPTTLKQPKVQPPCRSDTLHPSLIPAQMDPRAFYLTQRALRMVPPPLISVSEFVPRSLIGHLMRRKKNSALGVKFEPDRERDEITNMEGALHTFVTPVIARCEMVGDYRYDPAYGGHGVSTFGDVVLETIASNLTVRMARTVVMSASIQLDFEYTNVMLRVCRLDRDECRGVDLFKRNEWFLLGVKAKQDAHQRARYDKSLRRHMVFHLTRSGRLPPRGHVKRVMMYDEAVSFLELLISSGVDLNDRVVDKFVELENDHIVSLELLFNTALHQVRNEFSALEVLCPSGYVYTYDPASIFAREIGASLLNRLMLAGLRCVSASSPFANLRIFAFNDYADKQAVSLASKALIDQAHVQVVRKSDLFSGPGGKYDTRHYDKAVGAMLVVHNNSDAFGQNIETEGAFGSLDGAIGCNSSSAASLSREREDLLDNIL